MIAKTKTLYPIDLSTCKYHLHMDPSDNDWSSNDVYLNSLIKAATQMAENYIEKDIALTACVAEVNLFSGSSVTINEGNLVSVGAIYDKYNHVFTTVRDIDRNTDSFTLQLNTLVSPSTDLQINFVTGFDGSANVCPEALKQIILIKIGDLYDSERSSYAFNGARKSEIFYQMLQPYKSINW
jgi:hypothetical protein